jgi:uncharacterized protein YecE (DUF72 family)
MIVLGSGCALDARALYETPTRQSTTTLAHDEHMSELRIGTVDLPPRTQMEHFFTELTTVEITALVAAPMKPGTLAKWKSTVPARSIGLHAPWVITHRKNVTGKDDRKSDQVSGEFRDSAVARAALAELAEAAIAIDAWSVVFPSPPLFSPSQAHRDRLRAFFADVAPAELFGDRARVWIPDPLWEPVSAVRFATELGVLCAIDPLVKDLAYRPGIYSELDTPYAYFRLLGLGRVGPLKQDQQDELAGIAAAYDSAAVIFATVDRWKDAKNFKRNLAELAGLDDDGAADFDSEDDADDVAAN